MAEADKTRLRYVSADHVVDGPRSTLFDFDVRNLDDEKIGRLDGIIIDPPARKTCYLVIDVGRFSHHRYLLPIGQTRVDPETRALRMDVDKSDIKQCTEFDDGMFENYGDEDLLNAMFH